MPALFDQAAARFGERALVDFLGRQYTYRQLQAEAQAFAAWLQGRGVAKGDRVGLFLPNVPNYISAYYGAMIAGASWSGVVPPGTYPVP